MSFKPHKITDEAPAQPHLGLGIGGGKVVAIPIGAAIYIIEDPARVDKTVPLVLKKVRIDKLVFEMHGSDGSLTEYTYKLTSGKPLNQAGLERMRKNRGGG